MRHAHPPETQSIELLTQKFQDVEEERKQEMLRLIKIR
jgi:hypothetical protein